MRNSTSLCTKALSPQHPSRCGPRAITTSRRQSLLSRSGEFAKAMMGMPAPVISKIVAVCMGTACVVSCQWSGQSLPAPETRMTSRLEVDAFLSEEGMKTQRTLVLDEEAGVKLGIIFKLQERLADLGSQGTTRSSSEHVLARGSGLLVFKDDALRTCRQPLGHFGIADDALRTGQRPRGQSRSAARETPVTDVKREIYKHERYFE